MSALLRGALLLALAAASAAQAPPEIRIAGALLLDYEQLRDFAPRSTAQRTRYGPLSIEIRKVTLNAATYAVTEPGSVLVRYRNRLVAAATGYRLGAFPTSNGVTIEHWDGGGTCSYTRWQLKFAGERLVLHDSSTVRSRDCRAR